MGLATEFWRIFIPCLSLLFLCQFVQGSETYLRTSLTNGTILKGHKVFHKVSPSYRHSNGVRVNRRQLDDDQRTTLQTVLNASGVLGLGFLWIKEITAAIGSPILAPFLFPPLILIATFVLFFPNIGRFVESLLFPM